VALILERYVYRSQNGDMKTFNNIILILVICGITVSFSNCQSSQKLKNPTSLKIGEVYYENWEAGVQDIGSGYTIFIPILNYPKNITLDSVYFKGNKAKLEFKNNTVFVGRFKTTTNKKQDIIMSNEPYAEYANKVPVLPEKIPFELKDDECIVSYLVEEEIKYFKIEGIVRKAYILYQTVPSNKL
jgi:hypothetical protein